MRFEVMEDAYLETFNPETMRFEKELVARAGDIVYAFTGPTYGCISPSGIAVSYEGPNINPFFEVAIRSLRSVATTN